MREPTWLVLNSLASTPKADPRLSLPSFTSSPSASMFNRRALASVPPARREDICHLICSHSFAPKIYHAIPQPHPVAFSNSLHPRTWAFSSATFGKGIWCPTPPHALQPQGCGSHGLQTLKSIFSQTGACCIITGRNGVNHCSHIISFRVILGVTVAHREHPHSC